jgi:hypothetical protein
VPGVDKVGTWGKDFSSVKNYGWESGMSYSYYNNTLIEKNVHYCADQSLGNKGFTLNTDKPDFLISMKYETEYSDPYKLRILNLNIYRPESKGRIWQGTTSGTINADAASSELAVAVQRILTNFPPRGGR